MALACGVKGKGDCEKGCVVSCNKHVFVELIPKPEVHCRSENLHTSFPVALKIKVNPRCQISEARVHQSHDRDCEHTCFFNVDIFADCHAEACAQPCERRLGKVDLFVRTPVKTRCLPGKEPCDRSSSSSDDRRHGKHHGRK